MDAFTRLERKLGVLRRELHEFSDQASKIEIQMEITETQRRINKLKGAIALCPTHHISTTNTPPTTPSS